MRRGIDNESIKQAIEINRKSEAMANISRKKTNRVLYLREMGWDDANIPTDIKNHRIRTIENVDIMYKKESYNMFFEFTFWERHAYRTVNKRTGKQLKNAVNELVNPMGIGIDTEYEKDEYDDIKGYKWRSSWRLSALEKEAYDMNLSYTKAGILRIINRYAIEPFGRVVLIEEESRKITEKIGGYREKSIINNDPVFEITETWNDDHKIVRVTERIKTDIGNNCYRHEMGNSFELDLITGKITN